MKGETIYFKLSKDHHQQKIKWKFLSQDFWYIFQKYEKKKKDIEWIGWGISQIRYSLVVILELNDVSEVQYKDVMIIDDGKYQ